MQKLKRLHFAIILLSLLIPTVTLAAAPTKGITPERPEKNEATRIVEESEGNVEIEIPVDIEKEIFSQQSQQQSQAPRGQVQTTHKKGGRTNGYRIMVFADGRNPSTLQARARARGNSIASRLPKYRGQIYVYSKSPNWYCTIGNFKSSGEASAALSELKRTFPQFSSEMRVVNSQITIK